MEGGGGGLGGGGQGDSVFRILPFAFTFLIFFVVGRRLNDTII